MKKVRLFLFTFLIMVAGIISVNAASISVSTNKKTVTVGSTVKVTVTVSPGSDKDEKKNAASWEYNLNYDSSMFTFQGENTHIIGGTLAGNKSVTFTFKAKKSGTSIISLKNVLVQNYEGKNLSVSPGSVTITAKTQAEIEANYSTDANLKSLSVEKYSISPSFNKDKLEYNLEVENDVDSIVIHYSTSHSAATVSGGGKKKLSEGVNKFKIVVTAQKGNKKTYVLNVTRKELNPIKIDVNGIEYSVIRKADVMDAPALFSSTTVIVNDVKVPAFVNEVMDVTLIGLKDDQGNIGFFKINDDGSYSKYVQINLNSIVFTISEPPAKVRGYDNTKLVDFNGENVTIYVNPNYELALIYGTNVANGQTGWYQYDQQDNTLQRYIPVVMEENNDDAKYKFFALVCGGGLGISIIIILILLGVVSSRGTKNRKLVDLIESKIEMPTEEVKVVRRDVSDDEIGDETRALNGKFLDLIEKEGEDKRNSKASKKDEKQKKKQEKDEAKAMKEDFLKTMQTPVIQEEEEEIVIKEVPKKRGRPKKSDD